LGGKKDFDKLIGLLKHKKAEVRIEAIEDLMELEDPRAVDPLIECLEDKDT